MSRVDTLWFTRCPAPSAASVAIQRGLLEQEFAPDGIAVRSLASSRDRSVQLSHYRHTQPDSFRFGGYVPPLVAASRGADLKVIGLSWPDRTAAVLALPDSGIEKPGHLRGKRLAVPRRLNDSIDWWRASVLEAYRHALAKAGLGWDDVRLVDVEIPEEYVADAAQGDRPDLSLWGARSQFAVQRRETAALLRGEVDAVFSDAAMGALIRAFLGLVPVIDLTSREDAPLGDAGSPLVLTVSGALLDARPDLVTRWLIRLLEAGEWAPDHIAETRRILAQDTGLPEDLVEAAYSARIYGQLDISLSEERLGLLRARHDQLLADGFLDAALEFDALVDFRPLTAARADSRATSRPDPAPSSVR